MDKALSKIVLRSGEVLKFDVIFDLPNSDVTKQEMTITVCGASLFVLKVYAPA